MSIQKDVHAKLAIILVLKVNVLLSVVHQMNISILRHQVVYALHY